MLFTIDLEHVMEMLMTVDISTLICRKFLRNLQFADDIDLMVEMECEIQDLTTKLKNISGSHVMEFSI